MRDAPLPHRLTSDELALITHPAGGYVLKMSVGVCLKSRLLGIAICTFKTRLAIILKWPSGIHLPNCHLSMVIEKFHYSCLLAHIFSIIGMGPFTTRIFLVRQKWSRQKKARFAAFLSKRATK